MPPLALRDMPQTRSQEFEVDVERQSVGDKNTAKEVPTLVLTVPNDKDSSSNSKFPAKDGKQFLPLPSSKYRYTKWHDIDHMEVKGNMLRSPRIRRAPNGYNVSTIQDEETSSQWKRRKRLSYQNKLECWETCEAVNLSFQELGHSFQIKQFLAVLQKLIRCESLQLMDNGLTDLSSIYLPRCKYLCLQRNYLSNLKKLPKAPMLEHLSLQQNNITSLEGLSILRRTTIISLTLRDNPIELDPYYRKRVFELIPSLQVLDDIPRLEEDLREQPSSTCCIS
ncbi:leucine-rich repeat-containing 46-like isoform X1 [Paramuricea clavata]|uniref:Leucine-rich repeat-containing 46-like isoform X1 n=1 Tax=Paramuricea clavata TaxID=317549 RepID=A0A6S7FI55_PARCT|nr:leucine-rich repeat-containing 46-like isoform X1 [Paramuricea clavata]